MDRIVDPEAVPIPTVERRALLQSALSVIALSGCGPKLSPVACAAGALGPICDDGSGGGLDVSGTVVRTVARAFGLRHDETCVFTDGYALYERVVNLKGEENRSARRQALQDEGQAQIDGAMQQLKDAIEGKPSDQLGSSRVLRLPAEGRYVVFSDHHFTFKGHRTNFFEESGNLQVYVEALDAYREAGFTVVENGDVEDLVIFDPTWLPGEVETRKCMHLKALVERRLTTRLDQLRTILADPVNAPLIAAYQALDAGKQLIRVAGNHDYDLQKPEFFAELSALYPNLDVPYDYVLIDREDGSCQYAILHGHQFDLATNPVSAPRFGETISETMGLYYQGPDRTWRWLDDKVGDWATGEEKFLSNLVVNEAALTTSAEDLVHGKHDPVTYDLDVNPGAHKPLLQAVVDLEGALFESIFKHTVGWHYFLDRNPTGAFTNEVLTGDRFFKYQLLDEIWVKKQLLHHFQDVATRPTLVMGHTHEVRLDSWDPDAGKAFPWYVNTGSAGRFENLIWGLEIVDGAATLISWSRTDPPDGPVERREWKSLQADGNGWVRASKETAPLAPRPVTAPR